MNEWLYRKLALQNHTTDCEMIPEEGRGVSGAVRGTTVQRFVGTTHCSTITHKPISSSIYCSVYCANAFRTDSSNSSFTTKSCACASIEFLAEVISWSVDSTCSSCFLSDVKTKPPHFAKLLSISYDSQN